MLKNSYMLYLMILMTNKSDLPPNDNNTNDECKSPVEAKVVISWDTPDCKDRAKKLSQKLQLPLIPHIEEPVSTESLTHHSYILIVTSERLELRLVKPKGREKIVVDFEKGSIGYRRLKGGGYHQLIAKALGLKSGKPKPLVLDATAGFGQDAFILASLGCQVMLIERSPVIAELLLDGLLRAKKNPELSEIIRRMEVKVVDACQWLTQHTFTEKPDIIYLDPMFPKREKSALVKIEMRVLADIVGRDEDADQLLSLARSAASTRVVVKRPQKAEPLAFQNPNFVVSGRKNRYDVYLC